MSELFRYNVEKLSDSDDFKYSLSELKNFCNENEFKLDLPALSRLVSKLIKGGYLEERREGRMKYISLTDIGLIFCPVFYLYNEFQENLKLKN